MRKPFHAVRRPGICAWTPAIIGLLVTLTGCTCNRGSQQAASSNAQPASSKGARVRGARVRNARLSSARVRGPALSEQMHELQQLTAELRRRIAGSVAIGAPAQRLAQVAQQLPSPHEVAGFAAWKKTLVDRAEQLVRGDQHKEHFNALLAACRGCHALPIPGTGAAHPHLRGTGLPEPLP